MRITLKTFQEDYVGDLHQQFRMVQNIVTRDQVVAVWLNAPTGSGKTMMATAFIEELLRGSDTGDPDPDYFYLWLTDQPELNKQNFDKMKAPSELPLESLVIINGGFDTQSAGSTGTADPRFPSAPTARDPAPPFYAERSGSASLARRSEIAVVRLSLAADASDVLRVRSGRLRSAHIPG